MLPFQNLAYDTAHALDTGVLVLSFALLYQRRLFGVIKIYALQALLLAAAAAWQAHAQDAPTAGAAGQDDGREHRRAADDDDLDHSAGDSPLPQGGEVAAEALVRRRLGSAGNHVVVRPRRRGGRDG